MTAVATVTTVSTTISACIVPVAVVASGVGLFGAYGVKDSWDNDEVNNSSETGEDANTIHMNLYESLLEEDSRRPRGSPRVYKVYQIA
jgi:hypothetical protein